MMDFRSAGAPERRSAGAGEPECRSAGAEREPEPETGLMMSTGSQSPL